MKRGYYSSYCSVLKKSRSRFRTRNINYSYRRGSRNVTSSNATLGRQCRWRRGFTNRSTYRVHGYGGRGGTYSYATGKTSGRSYLCNLVCHVQWSRYHRRSPYQSGKPCPYSTGSPCRCMSRIGGGRFSRYRPSSSCIGRRRSGSYDHCGKPPPITGTKTSYSGTNCGRRRWKYSKSGSGPSPQPRS